MWINEGSGKLCKCAGLFEPLILVKVIKVSKSHELAHMGLDAGNINFCCMKKWDRPDCPSVQSDQYLCYSFYQLPLILTALLYFDLINAAHLTACVLIRS